MEDNQIVKALCDRIRALEDRFNRKEGDIQHNMTIEGLIEDLDELLQRHSRKLSTLEDEVVSLLQENKRMNDAINIGAANYVDLEDRVRRISDFVRLKYPGETP